MEQTQDISVFRRFRKYYRSIEPIIQKPKNRAYTAVVFSFLAISLFAWYAVRPTVQTIIYLQREITDKSVLNLQMEEKIQNLISAQAAYEEAKDKLPVLDEVIPNNPDVIDALSQLKNLVSTTQATLSSVRVTDIALVKPEQIPKQKTETKNEFVISMVVNGLYPEIETFLTSLTSMRRIMTIDQISFSKDKENQLLPQMTGNILKCTVQLRSYYK